MFVDYKFSGEKIQCYWFSVSRMILVLWKRKSAQHTQTVFLKSIMHIPPHSCSQLPLKAKTWCGLHAEEEAGTHLGTEAIGGIGSAVCCSTGFYWALNGPRCVQAAPIIQGQAVLGWWRWRWRERRERWGYESLLAGSTILRALLEDRERRVRGEGKLK